MVTKVQPKTFRSDAGKEVHQFLVDKKIYQQLTRNQMNASYAE